MIDPDAPLLTTLSQLIEDDPYARASPGGVRRHYLRLGNHAYPHMKFVVEETGDRNGWYFAVDCHDTAVRCANEADSEAWASILEQNAAVRAGIEAAWEANGLPTLHTITAAARRTRSGRLAAVGQGPGGQRAPMVMVVDDDEDAAELWSLYLRKAGFRTVVCTDPLSVVPLASRVHPDLMVLDYMMESLSGIELTQVLKQHQSLRHTPTMLCTYADISPADAPLATVVLRKPLTREQLVQKVTEFLVASPVRK